MTRPPHPTPRVGRSDPDFNAAIGRRIRNRRRSIGLTSVVLGEAVGVTYQQIYKYETGLNTVPPIVLVRLAKALRVPVGYLLGEEDGAEEPALNISVQRIHALLTGFDAIPRKHQDAVVKLIAALQPGDGARS